MNDEVQARSVSRWAAKLDDHDPSLLEHSLSVMRWATRLGVRLGVDGNHLRQLKIAAILHDVGKLTIPRSVLSKADMLEPSELLLVQTHARVGYELLRAESIHSVEVLDVVLHHHERLDGSGYPDSLRGAQIHGLVRIVTLCDVYSALIENRPYNSPMDSESALKRMAEKSSRLDMNLFKVFAEVVSSVVTKERHPEAIDKNTTKVSLPSS